jgi:hypothetical protein
MRLVVLCCGLGKKVRFARDVSLAIFVRSWLGCAK